MIKKTTNTLNIKKQDESYNLTLKLKKDLDYLMQQLREGDYIRVNTFANNFDHIMNKYEAINIQLSVPGVMERIATSDIIIAADLIAIGYFIEVVNNFFRCVSKDVHLQNFTKKNS